MSSPENMWVKFFTEAGLPSGISATYALTFTENRIQMNMLLDLNKEYLREMGIGCMGDVIAILRHAKKVHEETARDRVLNITEPKVPIAAVVARPGTPKAPTPAVRMLEHYTRNASVIAQNTTTTNTVTTVKDRLGAMQLSGIKRKVINIADSGATNDSKDRDDIIAPKLKKIVKQVVKPASEIQVAEKKVSTVFSRLGLNDDARPPSIITNTIKINATNNVSTPTTVFSRLGDKGKSEATRRSSLESNEPLEYAGILVKEKVVLKRKPIHPVKSFKKIGTMRADEEPISIKEKLPALHQNRKTVKFSPHVDYKEIEKRPAPVPEINIVPLRSVRTVALTSKLPNKVIKKKTITSVKARLGNPGLIKSNANNKSSVFNRLGLSSKG